MQINDLTVPQLEQLLVEARNRDASRTETRAQRVRDSLVGQKIVAVDVRPLNPDQADLVSLTLESGLVLWMRPDEAVVWEYGKSFGLPGQPQ